MRAENFSLLPRRPPFILIVALNYHDTVANDSPKVMKSYYRVGGSGGMALKIFWCFHALRELLVQSEANSYSTAIENLHDFMPLLTCCMKLKCIVAGLLPLPGSAFAFLVVLHLPAALELRRAGSGLDLEVCSC